jgi:ribosome-binding ATPase YchF (GTP1/OBG family)
MGDDYSLGSGMKTSLLRAGAACRASAKLQLESKDYVVKDGDVIHFKFNV